MNHTLRDQSNVFFCASVSRFRSTLVHIQVCLNIAAALCHVSAANLCSFSSWGWTWADKFTKAFNAPQFALAIWLAVMKNRSVNKTCLPLNLCHTLTLITLCKSSLPPVLSCCVAVITNGTAAGTGRDQKPREKCLVTLFCIFNRWAIRKATIVGDTARNNTGPTVQSTEDKKNLSWEKKRRS